MTINSFGSKAGCLERLLLLLPQCRSGCIVVTGTAQCSMQLGLGAVIGHG